MKRKVEHTKLFPSKYIRKFEAFFQSLCFLGLLFDSQTTMGKRRRFGKGLEIAFKAASSNPAILRGRKASYSRS